MKFFTKFKNYVAGAVVLSGAYAGAAAAAVPAGVQTALESAGTDAVTAGGYVIAAIAGTVVVGMIIRMVYKAG